MRRRLFGSFTQPRKWFSVKSTPLVEGNRIRQYEKSLFGCKGLYSSSDMSKLTIQANERVNELVDKLEHLAENKLHLSNPQHALYLLDSVSNELCAVVDVSELCRNIHDDEVFRNSAEEAFSDLMSSIHTLNALTSIYNIINDIYCASEAFQKLSDEEKMFVFDMKTEYEAEGITLPHELKSTLLNLQNEIVAIETSFLNNCNTDHSLFELGNIPSHNLPHLRTWIESFVPQRPFDDTKSMKSSIVCTSSKRVSMSLLKSLQSDSTRESLWYQIWFEPYQNMAVLGALIQKRQALSALLNKPSFAHKYLEKQALKSPQDVQGYLELLSAKTRPQAEKELGELTDLKRRLTGNNDETLHPWDVSFYTTLHTEMNKEMKNESAAGQDRVSSERYDQNTLSQYMSLGNCIQGLMTLSKQLFGIEFVKQPLSESETWLRSGATGSKLASGNIFSLLSSLKGENDSANSWDDSLRTGVFKFDVYENDSKSLDVKIGTVYLDLYNRREKFPGSALFSLQGGCRVSYHNLEPKQNDPMNVNLDNIPFQPAHVALVMSLSAPTNSSTSPQSNPLNHVGPLLTLHEVETLHHEWGHLLHSLLSRTAFQHLSGTRTSMDFSEVPSHLFEYFARCPEVVRTWARHHRTGTPLPSGLLESVLACRGDQSALELQSQILFSAADQYIFGPNIAPSIQDASPEEAFWHVVPGLCDLQASLTCLPFAMRPADGLQTVISEHGVRVSHQEAPLYNEALMDSVKSMRRFGIKKLPSVMPMTHSHFVNYGAGYYSYLFARMYAAQIWETHFKADPLSRSSGTKLRYGMLQYGAAKNPQIILDEMANGPLDPNYFLSSIMSEY